MEMEAETEMVMEMEMEIHMQMEMDVQMQMQIHMERVMDIEMEMVEMVILKLRRRVGSSYLHRDDSRHSILRLRRFSGQQKAIKKAPRSSR